MAAFFFLMTAYISPDEQNREEFFTEMALLDKKGVQSGGGSLGWYHVRSDRCNLVMQELTKTQRLAFGVLQWIPMSIILWIATVISLAVGTYCSNSNNIHFAHIWVRIPSSEVDRVLLTLSDYHPSNSFDNFCHRIYS
jgi:hypothetical protein